MAYINLCVLAGENPGDYYSVLIVVTGLALLMKYVQITTVYSLFRVLISLLGKEKTLSILFDREGIHQQFSGKWRSMSE